MSDTGQNIAPSVKLGEGVVIFKPELVNLYGCSIDSFTTIGPFVEIQNDVKIGKNCKISSHTFICEGVTLESGVFIGHGVMFTNDRMPRAMNEDGSKKAAGDWKLEQTHVGQNASIGSGAVILPGLSIGEGAIVGAGSVVTKNVSAFSTVVGNPAKQTKKSIQRQAVE